MRTSMRFCRSSPISPLRITLGFWQTMVMFTCPMSTCLCATTALMMTVTLPCPMSTCLCKTTLLMTMLTLPCQESPLKTRVYLLHDLLQAPNPLHNPVHNPPQIFLLHKLLFHRPQSRG